MAEINRKTDKKLDSVAIILDGNGRWAEKRGLDRTAGHAAGIKIIEKMLVYLLKEVDVHHVTLYAFSTENWKRPKREVDMLMNLMYKYIDTVLVRIIKSHKELSVKFLGDKSKLPEKLRNKCIEVENMAKGSSYICNIALNYGGRDEIVHAANAAVADGNTPITEEILSRYMYTSASPDPDLIIRTGGNFRISNFLLWQSAYSEYIILDTLWPDFTEADIDRCVAEFYKRNRRFGGVAPAST